MSSRHRSRTLFLAVLMASALAALLAARAEAGGPLLLSDGRPVLWAHRNVSGGPLGSQTVAIDAQGTRTVFYHVHSGPLGTLSNPDAVHLVDRIFGEYSSIANIHFANAGPILDPSTGTPIDVNATNIGLVLSSLPTFQNPIVFDSDGSITGGGGIIGFFGYLATEPD